MSLSEENALLKMMIETQSSRIKEQEETIKELRGIIEDFRSVKANLEETLEEFRLQFFGVKSEKTTSKEKADGSEPKKEVKVKAHTRTRKPKATRDELYANLSIREILCPLPDTERFCE